MIKELENKYMVNVIDKDKGFFINSGVANNGMKIDMFLDQSGKIISAFPEE